MALKVFRDIETGFATEAIDEQSSGGVDTFEIHGFFLCERDRARYGWSRRIGKVENDRARSLLSTVPSVTDSTTAQTTVMPSSVYAWLAVWESEPSGAEEKSDQAEAEGMP